LRLVHVRKKITVYADIGIEKIWELIKLFQYGCSIFNKVIRGILSESFPSVVHVSSCDIHNLKLPCLQFQGELIINAHDIELKNDFFDFTVKGIEERDLQSNKAGRLSPAIFREMLSASAEGWKLLHYLKLLREKDPSFTHHVAYDNEGLPTGFAWMTGTMRYAFETYGEMISLDAMKRQLNSVHWPYMAPVVLDGDKKIFVAAEGFVCGELHAMRIFSC